MGGRLRIYLCVRADDARTWPWRYGVVNEVSGYVVVAKGARPSSLRRVAAEVEGLGRELWFWLGGASDCVIDRVIKSFGGPSGLVDFLRSMGFNGLLGPDYTVYWCDESLVNYRRFVKYFRSVMELLYAGDSFVVPQVKGVGLKEVGEVLMRFKGFGVRRVFYNASFDLRDYMYVKPKVVLTSVRTLGMVPWVGAAGWLSELGVLSGILECGDALLLWRHLTRLAYPGRTPGEELLKLMDDLRRRAVWTPSA